MRVNVSKLAVTGMAAKLDYSISKLGKWGMSEELQVVRKARDILRGIEMQIAK